MAEKKEPVEKKEPAEKKESAKKPAAKKETAAKKEKSPFLLYKGRPLVRSGDTIYYGKMNEKYVVMLQILSKGEKNGVTVAEKVKVQVIATDPTLLPPANIIKTSDKVGLYNALDLGAVWLERALAGKLS